MLMEIQGYDLIIAYRTGKEILLADWAVKTTEQKQLQPSKLGYKNRVCAIQYEELKEESRNDQVVLALKNIYICWMTGQS